MLRSLFDPLLGLGIVVEMGQHGGSVIAPPLFNELQLKKKNSIGHGAIGW
jgi:hypothetical protein